MANHETELRIAWEHHLGASPPSRRLFDSVLARHHEPHRRYHGVAHVGWVVRHARTLAADIEVTGDPDGGHGADRVPCDLGAVIAAAFFHDAIYLPTASDNEAASARLARRELDELDDPAWPAPRVDHVATMIVATAHHHDGQHDGPHDDQQDDQPGAATGGSAIDTAILLDADLAVLGADPGAYASYVRGVRAEYAHVDDSGWRLGRRAVIDGFLARPTIYATAGARRRWEAAARANLTSELATLGRPG